MNYRRWLWALNLVAAINLTVLTALVLTTRTVWVWPGPVIGAAACFGSTWIVRRQRRAAAAGPARVVAITVLGLPQYPFVCTHNAPDLMTWIESRGGVMWDEAPLPGWVHRCYVQTRGNSGPLTYIERCPCGATRIDHLPRWMDRNQTRIMRLRARRRAPKPGSVKRHRPGLLSKQARSRWPCRFHATARGARGKAPHSGPDRWVTGTRAFRFPWGTSILCMGFLTRLLIPRSVRRAAHPVRAVKRAATPQSVKRLSRAMHPVSNAVYGVERSLNTKKRRKPRSSRAPIYRHGTCTVKHRTAAAAAQCRHP